MIPLPPNPFLPLDQIHEFEWYVVMCGSIIGHTKHVKEIELYIHYLLVICWFNKQQSWEI